MENTQIVRSIWAELPAYDWHDNWRVGN